MLDRFFPDAGADVELNIKGLEQSALWGLEFEQDRIREALGLLGFNRLDLHFEQGGVQSSCAPFQLSPLMRTAQLKPGVSPWCAAFLPESAHRYAGDLEVLWHTEDNATSIEARLREALFHVFSSAGEAQGNLGSRKFWLFFLLASIPAAVGCSELLPLTHAAGQFFYTVSEQSARIVCDGVRLPSWFSPFDAAFDRAVQAHLLLQKPLIRRA
jgi:hypothetical protein